MVVELPINGGKLYRLWITSDRFSTITDRSGKPESRTPRPDAFSGFGGALAVSGMLPCVQIRHDTGGREWNSEQLTMAQVGTTGSWAGSACRCWPLALAAGVALSGLVTGCGGKREVKQVEPVVVRDVPDVLRGTIGSEAQINGTQPQLVSGFGIVVNLNGTGGGDLMPSVAATMERELARNGVGKGGNFEGVLKDMSPQEFLRHPNVAVVIVEAQVPPGAPEGATFDVSVRTIPGSSVTSLEGGTLWSTDLRLGPATTFGGYKTRRIAVARGPIFINPFSESGSPDDTGVSRTVGRVLGGAEITDPLKLELVLDSDSHARARSVVAAINGRFPRGTGELGQTARGRGAERSAAAGEGSGSRQSIAISVPREYRDRPAEFLQLLRYTRVDPSYPEEFARRYVEALKTTPGMAEELGWCLKALGKSALPFLVPLYDYPEMLPRMTALEAGAFLGDARTGPHLITMARSGTPAIKTRAIRLMAKLQANPQINLALREFVNAPELDVRIAAWEGLSALGDAAVLAQEVGPDPVQPKFTLETVASREPMVYVTQQGKPKIVLFGDRGGKRGDSAGLRVSKPLLVSAWSDRFLLTAESPESELRVRYLSMRNAGSTPLQGKPPEDMSGFIEYLARRPTPEDPAPGLDMTFSEVVGVLYEMTRQNGLSAVFATEQDKLRAEIFEAAQATLLTDRPETSEPEGAEAQTAEATVFQPRSPVPLRGVDQVPAAADWKPRIVPLSRPSSKKPGRAE